VAKPLSWLQSSRGVGAGGGNPPPAQSVGAGAIRLFYDTRNTVRCNNYYDYVTGLCWLITSYIVNYVEQFFYSCNFINWYVNLISSTVGQKADLIIWF